MRMAGALLFAMSLEMAQGAGPVGPTAGWTLDNRTGSIRAITGLAGALRLADPVSLPFGVTAAEFSASGDAAVVLTSGQPGHLAVLRALRSAVPAIVDLGEIAEGSQLLALNAKGSTAGVYFAARQELRFVSGVSGSASLSEPFSTAALAGPITASVIDESGQCAIVGTGSLETLCADGSSRRILQDANLRVTGLALANSDLWVSDAASKTVFRVSNYDSQSTSVVFASERDGLLNPCSLAVAPSGSILVADNDASAIFAIDPLGAGVQSVPLSVTATQLRPLTERSLLLVNDLNTLPFTLFSSEAMRTYFVPAN